MQRNPVEGKGGRNHDCPYYDECLKEGAANDWKAFSCDECTMRDDLRKTGSAETGTDADLPGASVSSDKDGPASVAPGKSLTEEKGPTEKRRCRQCKERPTITAHVPLCARCMAAKGNQKRWKKAQQKKSAEFSSPPAPGLTEPTVTINFGKYARVLKAVEELAEREMRPLEMQIVFMLNRQIESP